MINVKKIPTWLYLLLSAVVYFGLIMLNIFVINSNELSGKLILTIVFAVMVFLHFAFVRSHYDEFLQYTFFNKVLTAILSFFYVAAIGIVVRFKLTDPINMIILINSCTLVFPVLMTMISVLIVKKARLLSRIVYYCGIVELFAGGLATIISLYNPSLFIKSLR